MKKIVATFFVLCVLNLGVLSVSARPADQDFSRGTAVSGCRVETTDEGFGIISLYKAIRGVIIHLLDGGQSDCGKTEEKAPSRFGVIIH